MRDRLTKIEADLKLGYRPLHDDAWWMIGQIRELRAKKAARVSDDKDWPCCGYSRTGGHNGTCTFYGLDEPASKQQPKERT